MDEAIKGARIKSNPYYPSGMVYHLSNLLRHQGVGHIDNQAAKVIESE
jgi:hypothetical protein